MTLHPPVDGCGPGRWSCREIGAQLGVSEASVARVWREYGVAPRADGAYAFTVQPVMNATTVSVVGVCVTARVRLVALLLDEPDARPAIFDGGIAGTDAEAPRPGVRDFLRQLAGAYRGRRLHLVVDDGGIRRRLLDTLPLLTDAQIPVHVTLGTASWLNLVEVWHALMERDGRAETENPAGRIRDLVERQRSTLWVASALEADATARG